MYTPKPFRETDVGANLDFVEEQGFGVLISRGATGPAISHLPVLVERDRGRLCLLRAHVAKGTTGAASMSGPPRWCSTGRTATSRRAGIGSGEWCRPGRGYFHCEEILGAGGARRGRPTSLALALVDLIAAREFLPDLPAADLLQAYAACGGYPLHLRKWNARRSTQDNLRRLAFTPGGVLLEDADGILREELSPTGGYAQILAAIGRGRTRFSHIAGDVGQRIDHALAVLIRTGFVAKVLPVGAPRGARGT